MDKKNISQRHRPSVKTYIWQNIKTSFWVTEKARATMTLVLLLSSAILGYIGYLTAPEINEFLSTSNIRIAFGLVVFLVFQFLVFTPCRMWRESTWVANIEKLLDELWDCHERGVDLLNKHTDAIRANPELLQDPNLQQKYIEGWDKEFHNWTEDTKKKIDRLYPLEAKRFRNVVSYNPRSIVGGVNAFHDQLRSMLLVRLNMVDAIITRHQPSLLPER